MTADQHCRDAMILPFFCTPGWLCLVNFTWRQKVNLMCCTTVVSDWRSWAFSAHHTVKPYVSSVHATDSTFCVCYKL